MRILSVLLTLAASAHFEPHAASSLSQRVSVRRASVDGDGYVDPKDAQDSDDDLEKKRKEEEKAAEEAEKNPPKEDKGADDAAAAEEDIEADAKDEVKQEEMQENDGGEGEDADTPAEDEADSSGDHSAEGTSEADEGPTFTDEEANDSAAEDDMADQAKKDEASSFAEIPESHGSPQTAAAAEETYGEYPAMVDAPVDPLLAGDQHEDDEDEVEVSASLLEVDGSELDGSVHDPEAVPEVGAEPVVSADSDGARERALDQAYAEVADAENAGVAMSALQDPGDAPPSEDAIQQQLDEAEDEREAKVRDLPDPGKDSPPWIRDVFENVKKLMQDRADVVRDVRLVEDTENQVQNLLDECQDVVVAKKKENLEEVQQLRQIDGLLETGRTASQRARSQAQDTLRRLVELDRLTSWAQRRMDQMKTDVQWEKNAIGTIGTRQQETRKVWEEQMPEIAKQTDRSADVFERKTRSVLLDVKADLHSNDQVLKNLENAQGLTKVEVSNTEKQDSENRVHLDVLDQKLKRSHEMVDQMANRMMRAEKEATFAEYQTRQTEGLEHMSKDYLAHTRKKQLAEREKADKVSRRAQSDTTRLREAQDMIMSASGKLESTANLEARRAQEKLDAVSR